MRDSSRPLVDRQVDSAKFWLMRYKDIRDVLKCERKSERQGKFAHAHQRCADNEFKLRPGKDEKSDQWQIVEFDASVKHLENLSDALANLAL
jgi:hypothetical protein